MTRYVRNSGGAWHTEKLRLSFPKQFSSLLNLVCTLRVLHIIGPALFIIHTTQMCSGQ